jgi:hypothetical protein
VQDEAQPPTTYLVEHYWPGLTADAFRSASERVRAAADAMARAGTPIRFVRSIMVPSDEAAFCLLDAASEDVIAQLYTRAGVRFDRIVAALEA